MEPHVNEIKLCKEIDNLNIKISLLKDLATDNRLNNDERSVLQQKISVLEEKVQQKVHQLDLLLLLWGKNFFMGILRLNIDKGATESPK